MNRQPMTPKMIHQKFWKPVYSNRKGQKSKCRYAGGMQRVWGAVMMRVLLVCTLGLLLFDRGLSRLK